MNDECVPSDYGEDGLLCETHGLADVSICTTAAAALRARVSDNEAAVALAITKVMDLTERAEQAEARVRELEVNIAEMRQHHQKQLNSTFNLLATVLSSVGRTP